MSRLAPLTETQIPEEARPLFDMAKNMMGFTPNDAVVMARHPGILKGVAAMCASVYGPGKVDNGTKRLIGYIASTAAGCVYCQSHTAHGAHNQGVDAAKITAAWEYETSDLFSDKERAALRVAQAGAMSPSEVTDTQFADLKQYWSDDEIVEIVAVISMFGFLNRWNAILETQIEDMPMNFVKSAGLDLK